MFMFMFTLSGLAASCSPLAPIDKQNNQEQMERPNMNSEFAKFTESPPPLFAAPGRIVADEYESLQAAVDSLGPEGGVVLLGPRTYELDEPLLIRRKVVLQGVMDAKVRFSSSKIAPSDSFRGEWLIKTVPQPANENPDLNADFGIYDLVMEGSPDIGGIKGTNIDVIRMERSRLAYMRRCLDITQLTDLPRPYPARIVPGGVFINNCIFQAFDICINLEYSTQNRIYANWFVSNSGVVLRLLNSNKTWFFANEINQFSRAGILLEDDGGGGNHVHNVVIALNWFHSRRADTKFIEVVNGDPMYNIVVTDNIMEGTAGIDLPFQNVTRGHVFRNNAGSGVKTDAVGRVQIPAGQSRAQVSHTLMAEPTHVAISPHGRAPEWWIENIGPNTFEVHIEHPASSDLSFSWEARIGD